MGKELFFELACMPEGIENFEEWNQRWGTIYQTIKNVRFLIKIDFVQTLSETGKKKIAINCKIWYFLKFESALIKNL